MNSINEKICKAAQIMAEKQLQNLKYDVTIEGEVVGHNSNSSYIIRYNNGDIIAESNENFLIGDRVCVLVPANDFSRRKIILGKLGSNREYDEFFAASENVSALELDDARLETGEVEKVLAQIEVDGETGLALRPFLSAQFENLARSYGHMRILAQLATSANFDIDFTYGLKITFEDGSVYHLLLNQPRVGGLQSAEVVLTSQFIDSIVLFSEKQMEENQFISLNDLDISFVDEESTGIFDVKLFGPDGLFIPDGGSLRLEAHTSFGDSALWYYKENGIWIKLEETSLVLSNITQPGDYKVVLIKDNSMIEDEITLVQDVQGLVSNGVKIYSQHEGDWIVEDWDGISHEELAVSEIEIAQGKKFYFENMEYEVKDEPFKIEFIGQDTFVYPSGKTDASKQYSLEIDVNFVYRKVIWELPNPEKTHIVFNSLEKGNKIIFNLLANYDALRTNNIVKVKIIDFENRTHEAEKQLIFVPLG